METGGQQQRLRSEKYLEAVMCDTIMESEDVGEDTGLGMEVDETQDNNHNSCIEESQVQHDQSVTDIINSLCSCRLTAIHNKCLLRGAGAG